MTDFGSRVVPGFWERRELVRSELMGRPRG